MTVYEPEVLNSMVSRVFRIDDITWGDENRNYIVRYRGKLVSEDSESSYETLAASLKPLNITPLFRIENDQQIIMLIKGVSNPKPARISVNIALFLLTVVSVLLAGTMYSFQGSLPADPLGQIWTLLKNSWQGWPFAVSLLSILLAHEFGHYFVGRFHKTEVSLPYFIPFPFSFLGTMGAFINMKERPHNKRHLLDIGIAGPLAGLVVAIPVLVIGISLSKPDILLNTRYTHQEGTAYLCQKPAIVVDSYTCPDDNLLEGNSILYLGVKYLLHGELLPSPAVKEGPAWLYWVRFFFTGNPLPIGGRDIMLHPVAMAGWAGILVTFLNLIPAGQLDGGHVLYALFDRKAKKFLPFILVPMLAIGFIWNGWWLWAGLIFFLGRAQAEPLDQITKLNQARKVMAALTLLIFLLVLTPVPFVVF